MTVLTFHRVLDDCEYESSSSLPGILVRQRTFVALLDWLAKEYEIVDLGRGEPDWRATRRPRIALTFDDGWMDNLVHAWPAAARRNVSLTIFVCTDLAGRRLPFWPERVNRFLKSRTARELAGQMFPDIGSAPLRIVQERVVDRLKRSDPVLRESYLKRLESAAEDCLDTSHDEPCNQTFTWDQTRELHQNGVRIGSHTVSHQILTQIPTERVAIELSDSRRRIALELTSDCALLAYPNGNHSAEVRKFASEAGYSFAFTTEPGVWVAESDSFRIPRVNIHEERLVGLRGRFSRAMFEYSAFWLQRSFRN